MMISRTRLIAAVALFWLPAVSVGQGVAGVSPPGRDVLQTSTQAALEAFKRGDGAAGLGTLKNNPHRALAGRSNDAQVIDRLKEISLWMANEKHPRAVETATLALIEAEKTQGRLNAAESADMSFVAGRLCERITGDMSKAKESYEAALRLNPAHVEAAQGLKRLRALDALVAAKARENQALRDRRQRTSRP